jgi:hypothetical protein
MTVKRLKEILSKLEPDREIIVEGVLRFHNVVGCQTATACRTDCGSGKKIEKSVLVIFTDEKSRLEKLYP